MNLSSHILVRMGLDKSQFDAGMRNIKHEIRGLKDIKGVLSVGGVLMFANAAINAFRDIAVWGKDAFRGIDIELSDRFANMSQTFEDGATMWKGSIGRAMLYIHDQIQFVAKFWGAKFGGATWGQADTIARDNLSEVRAKREGERRKKLLELTLKEGDAKERVAKVEQEIAKIDELLGVTPGGYLRDGTDLVVKRAELESRLKELRTQAAKEAETETEKRKRDESEVLALMLQQAQTLMQLAQLEGQMRDARGDRGKYSLDELSNAPVDTVGGLQARNKARYIQYLEALAPRLRLAGRLSGPYSSQDALDTADRLRASLDGVVKSTDVNPFAATEKAISESKDHLRNISGKLDKAVPVILQNTP